MGNVEWLLAGVAPGHATLEFEDDEARLVPEGETATIHVDSDPVEHSTGGSARARRSSCVPRNRPSGSYRLRVFF